MSRRTSPSVTSAGASKQKLPVKPDRRTERRQAILQAAARLFAEVGYAECEIERVAAKLKIGKGTLYLYFPSKEELFYACVDAGMSALMVAVDKAVEPNQDPFQ